ncbi:hypothetical protein F511_16887 [Dorcoceras hygrometricum]|uniref:Uncharacterized protein n=1 Tax=Dorcoceras hygrometricum TaxID=472368 RepID=A0A2Z7DBF5_9LAMI|nr:hypothetical protein F511_16887 [Dorcoceras hygrometricum]
MGKAREEMVFFHAKLIHRGVATRGGTSTKLALSARVEELCEEMPVRTGLNCRAGRVCVLRWDCHPRRCQCGTGLKCSRRRATRGDSSAELGLSAEMVGFVCSGGIAIRGGANAELGLSARVEELREEIPVRNWA